VGLPEPDLSTEREFPAKFSDSVSVPDAVLTSILLTRTSALSVTVYAALAVKDASSDTPGTTLLLHCVASCQTPPKVLVQVITLARLVLAPINSAKPIAKAPAAYVLMDL
jgi:hypothetical protein